MDKIYEQNLWTKFIFVPFLIVNSIFNTVNSGKCCDCCDEIAAMNVSILEKKMREKSFLKKKVN